MALISPEYDQLVKQTSKAYNLDPAFLKTVIGMEDPNNPSVMGMIPKVSDYVDPKADTASADMQEMISHIGQALGDGLMKTGSHEKALRYFRGGPDFKLHNSEVNDYVNRGMEQYPSMALDSKVDYNNRNGVAQFMNLPSNPLITRISTNPLKR